MSNSGENEHEEGFQFRTGSHDFENRMHKFNMSFLRALAKPILPAGYWAKNRSPRHEDKTPINLTFDDGPDPSTTKELLVVLADEKVKGTFFFIGENIRRYPELVEAVYKAGHTIGNHSMTHPFLPSLNIKAVEKEIDQTNELVSEIVGASPTLFRAPYGILDKRCAEALKERRMSTVYWGAMADDYRPIGDQAVVSRIMKQIPGNELVVLHEGHHASQCISSTREIIRRSKALGFTFEAIE
ncbi:hypothetical protein BH11CYA1_BH11CYA1_46300 [soil metagenome]